MILMLQLTDANGSQWGSWVTCEPVHAMSAEAAVPHHTEQSRSFAGLLLSSLTLCRRTLRRRESFGENKRSPGPGN